VIGPHRVFNTNFKRMVDATITASGLMVGLSLVFGNAGRLEMFDLLVSLVLLLSGAWAGVPRLLAVTSSVPLYFLDEAVLPHVQGHHAALLLVGLRAVRIGYDLRMIEVHSTLVGREILGLSVQAGILAGVMLAGGSIALYVAESGAPHSSIRTIWDALWASITTTTTVGYGDLVPVTPMGRLVAAMLMIFGVAYITFLITNIATVIVRLAGTSSDELNPIERERNMLIESLRTRLEEMSDEEFQEVMMKLNTIRVLNTRESFEVSLEEVQEAPSSIVAGEGEAVA